MEVRFLAQLATLDKTRWNQLNHYNNPFLRYEFLAALERHGCVGEDSGWSAQHITLWRNDQLIGALPMYIKQHSWGEFVFDWAWADAYARHGLAYYPKLVSAVPYTPVSGQRFLALNDDPEIKTRLLSAVLEYAKANHYSSWHCLFPLAGELEAATVPLRQSLSERWGYQFHWRNHRYQSFDDYLATMASAKRKKIRRERRRIVEQDIEVEYLSGHQISTQQWQVFYQYYLATFAKKGNFPAFSLAFFQELGARLPDQVLLILARHRGRDVAGAFFMRNDSHLYGRHWGCLAEFDSLHFELCYYAAIEYCILNQLHYFEAGAQGEHKLSRGFLPVKTYSLHWIAHEGFRQAIDQFLLQERQGVSDYIASAAAHSPFKMRFDQ